MTRARRTLLLDSTLLACLVCVLIWPLFRLRYLDNWPSIESTFIADARMLGEHLPHSGWQPLWYCGTRMDYIYPPALRYGTALIATIGNVATARAYHLYIALFYVFGILAVYWLVRVGSKSRAAAWLAAAATALLSPSFLLLRSIRADSGFMAPQRLHVLMNYGEGPHISALCVLPAALAAAFLALRTKRPAMLAAAGVLCALVVATNFYGATALAVFYPVMVWSVWMGERARGVLMRAVAIPLLAYGLSAFWLTPSYVRITLVNLHWVAQPGKASSQVVLLLVVVVYGLASFRFGAGRPERAWTVFAAGAAVVISVFVLGYFYFGLLISGEAARLIPELDLALILFGTECVRLLWKHRAWRIPLAAAVIVAFSPALVYFQYLRSPFPRSGPVENVYEYKIARWVEQNLSGARVLPTGSVRFWFDAWADNSQLDGGSMQGMLNQTIPAATWQILHGDRADLTVLWLQALGTDAVVVTDKTSFERYHDWSYPEKLRGAVPAIHDDHHGTVIYAIPRVHPGISRVVNLGHIRAIGKIQGGDDTAGLTKYNAVVEDPAQGPSSLMWRGFERADIAAVTAQGQALLVQETWDPAWHAYENGKELHIGAEETMGFMLIDLAPGKHSIRMQFETPFENRAGQLLFILSSAMILLFCNKSYTHGFG